MKKALFLLLILGSIVCLAQSPGTPTAGPGNTGGLLWASNFGQWSVPQGNTGQFSWSSPSFCTVTANGIPLSPVFATNTPVYIRDQVVANSEIVTPSAVSVSGAGCSITVSPVHPHLTFTLQSATCGLQEAINYAHGLVYQVVVTPDWARAACTTSTITSAKGSTNVSIMDERTSVYVPYVWNGSAYVAEPFGGLPYPPPGIPCSTGSSWCTSYSALGTGSGLLAPSGTPGAGKYVDGSSLAWTALPPGGTNTSGYNTQPCLDSSGSHTAQVCNTAVPFTPGINSCIVYQAGHSNSTNALTLDVNSLGPKPIAIEGQSTWVTVSGGTGWTTFLPFDSFPTTQVNACYDGTNWDVTGTGIAPGGFLPGFQVTADDSALTVNVTGGWANCDGTMIDVSPSGLLTLVADSTNYVYLDTSSSCAIGLNQSSFGTNIPLYQISTDLGIISIADLRTMASNGGSGRPGGSPGQLQWNDSSSFAGASGGTTNGTHFALGDGSTVDSAPATALDGTPLSTKAIVVNSETYTGAGLENGTYTSVTLNPITAPSNAAYGSRVDTVMSGANWAGSGGVGFVGNGIYNGTGTGANEVAFVAGGELVGNNLSTGQIGTADGAIGWARNEGGGTIDYAAGAIGNVSNDLGIITLAHSLEATFTNTGGTTAEYDGLYVFSPTGGGNITIAKGIDIQEQCVTGVGTCYEMHSEGTGLNEFDGTLQAENVKIPGQAAGSGDNCLQIDTSGNVTKTGSGCPTAYTGASPIVVSGSVISCPSCSVSSGTSVEVNGGSGLGTANLNGTTPAAPAGYTNCTWQISGVNTSCYVPTASSNSDTRPIITTTVHNITVAASSSYQFSASPSSPSTAGTITYIHVTFGPAGDAANIAQNSQIQITCDGETNTATLGLFFAGQDAPIPFFSDSIGNMLGSSANTINSMNRRAEIDYSSGCTLTFINASSIDSLTLYADVQYRVGTNVSRPSRQYWHLYQAPYSSIAQYASLAILPTTYAADGGEVESETIWGVNGTNTGVVEGQPTTTVDGNTAVTANGTEDYFGCGYACENGKGGMWISKWGFFYATGFASGPGLQTPVSSFDFLGYRFFDVNDQDNVLFTSNLAAAWPNGESGKGSAPGSSNAASLITWWTHDPRVLPVSFSPPAGPVSLPATITLSSSTGGATFCSTTDGSLPTSNGAGTCTHGSSGSSATVSSPSTLQAIATESGHADSALASGAYRTNATGTYTYNTFVTASSAGSMVTSITSSAISVTAGDFIFGMCQQSIASITTTPSSSPANTFNQLTYIHSSSGTLQSFYVLAAVSGSTTFTCSFGASGAFAQVFVYDFHYSGAGASIISGTDVSSGTQCASSSMSCTSGTYSTGSIIPGLVAFCGGVPANVTWTAGNIGGSAATLRGTATGIGNACEFLSTASGTFSGATSAMTIGTSETWNIAGAAFQ